MLTPHELREELIRQLDTGKLKVGEVARVLSIPPPRVSELRKRERRVQGDELAALARLLEVFEAADSDHRSPQIRVTAMPADTNPYGGVFGGWLMAQMALGAGSLASRVGQGKAVVVSATDFAFPGAMTVGDELSVYCDVLATGTTSLTIAAEAIARERNGEATIKVAEGTFKFVLIGEDGRPRAITERETLLLAKDNDNGQ
jgi:acyl-CoA thioesterase YciA